MKTEVGIEILKDHFVDYLQRAREGERIIITEHGRSVALLISLEEAARGEEITDLERIAREIDDVYGQISDLIAAQASDPGVNESVLRLRERLRALQRAEAEALERQLRSRLLFD